MTGTYDLKILAPAKINLYLYVSDRRDDGYHEISSLMLPVTLFDTVFLAKKENGIAVSCRGRYHVPGGRENIAFKAAELFFREFGLGGGVSVSIVKRIPSGSGLGGGSSDGAAVLKGLSILYRGGVIEEELFPLASRLGGDVPFFIHPAPSFVSGKGEILKRVLIPFPLYMVLAKPPESMSTALAYEMLDKMGSGRKQDVHGAFTLESAAGIVGRIYNDFEEVVFPHVPGAARWKDRLLNRGAYAALMTGSGSCVFGLFPEREVAEKVCDSLRGDEKTFLKVAENF